MEYYSATRKDILPYATTWMDLEYIMLRDKSDRKKTSTVGYHLYVESKNLLKRVYNSSYRTKG